MSLVDHVLGIADFKRRLAEEYQEDLVCGLIPEGERRGALLCHLVFPGDAWGRGESRIYDPVEGGTESAGEGLPLVEFYDDAWPTEDFPRGFLVTRYYASTLLNEHEPGTGLLLQDGPWEKRISLDPAACDSLMTHLAHIREFMANATDLPIWGKALEAHYALEASLVEADVAKPVRALLVPVGDVPRPVMLTPEPGAINRMLGCETFAGAFYEDEGDVEVALYVDDNGKFDGARPNRAVTDEDGRLADVVFGGFLVVAHDHETGLDVDLPADVERKYEERFHDPTTGTLAVLQAQLACDRKHAASKTSDPRNISSRARAAACARCAPDGGAASGPRL